MKLRPPGVSFLFEVGIDFYSAKKKKRSSLLYLLSTLIMLKRTYCTNIGTYCAQEKRGLLKVLNYIKHPLFLISWENLWLNCCMHFLLSSCVSDPHGASLTGCCGLQMFSAFTKWEGESWMLNSFSYHDMEPEDVYTAVTMEICLSTHCYVIKF